MLHKHNLINELNYVDNIKKTQQLTLHGTTIVHDDLKEYGHPYSFTLYGKKSKGNNKNTFTQCR